MNIGVVTLKVADLQCETAFYETILGLQVQYQAVDGVILGAGGQPLLYLYAMPEGQHYSRVTGLYHFALRVPTRAALARTLRQLIMTHTPIQGAADHIVSEALYLPDPEGNGIEIYWDRPREAWFDAQGNMQLATLPLDMEDMLAEAEGATGVPAETAIGHIHLHVADVPAAEAFYTNLLGMEVMFNLGSATFLAYDGYHHHVGANTWGGRVAPPEDALGLGQYVIHYDEQPVLDGIVARLDEAGYPLFEGMDGFIVHDPSQNQIMLTL